MSTLSATTEVEVPSVLDDFEPGDKVAYARINNSSLIGTVMSVETQVMWVNIGGSQRQPLRVGISGPENMFNVKRWRKIPDDMLIEVGDTMSTTDRRYMASLNSREFFEVTEIAAGKFIVLRSLEDGDSKIKFDDFAYGSLDEYLQYWELEG